MLTRIYVHNFRTFVNFEWEPPAACVLVGDNGAGKSGLIEVLQLLQDVIVKGASLEEGTSPSTRTAWLQEGKQSIEVELKIGDASYRYRFDSHGEQGRGGVHEELYGAGELLYRSAGGMVELFGDMPNGTARTTIPFDRRRSFLSALEPRPDNTRLIAFREAIGGIWAIKPDPQRLGEAAVVESAYLDRDLGNFASWYRSRMPEDPDAADLLRSDLQRVIKGFSTLRLEPISPEVKDLRARFSFGGKSHELGWAMLSDGQRLLIALYGLLRFGFSKATLIVLDECENYVAPAEIQPWLHAVADAAAKRHQQLLVVSHHPESINYLAADAAFRMWRDQNAGHTRIGPLSPDRDAGETAYDAVKFGLPGPLPGSAVAEHE